MSHRRYLPFPTTSNDTNSNSKTQPQKKKNCHAKQIKSKSKASKNTIKYDINDNKSKHKLNKIITKKINSTATHNLIHHPSIQRHSKKNIQSVLKNTLNRKPINPDEKWECSVCTYTNISIMAYCEICEAKKAKKHDEDEEIARKLQQDLNKINQAELLQKELEDAYLAKKIQSQLEAEERALKRKKHDEDGAMAKIFQKQQVEDLLKCTEQTLENERAALALQAKEDMDAAKYYEQKQNEDEQRMRSDESFAFKMQQELNKGAAWFCNGCFSMNMDIKQYQCSLCDTIRPKPAIPKYIMSMRDDLATNVLNAIREVHGSIVNITFVQNFIVKYFTMCQEIGTVLSYPKIVYHWTRSGNFDPISETGLKVPDGVAIRHQTDTGFYGRGIYTSPDPKYAQGYGHGANKVFVCLALTGRQYKASYPEMLGKALQKGYDSHVSKDRNEMEWVFFSSDQLLLCYLVTLDFLEAEAKTQMDYVCQFLESKFLAMRQEKLNNLTKDDV